LVLTHGYRGLNTIERIGKMDDNVYTWFNLNFDQWRSVERGKGRGSEFCGHIHAKTRESVHPVFTNAKFPR
jgi:hypothetical protein